MAQITLDSEQLDQLILQRLPTLVQQNRRIQELVLNLAQQKFADCRETGDRFYQLLNEIEKNKTANGMKPRRNFRKLLNSWGLKFIVIL